MRLLGVVASSYLQSTTAYYSIAPMVTVGSGGSASITFSGIDQTFKHLQLRGYVQDNRSTYYVGDLYVRFNGSSAANYNYGYMGGVSNSNGTVPDSLSNNNSSTGQTELYLASGSIGTVTGGTYGTFVIDIPDYTSSKLKSVHCLIGAGTNAGGGSNNAGRVYVNAGLWNSTSAISSITITANNGFTQDSSIALYGIKG